MLPSGGESPVFGGDIGAQEISSGAAIGKRNPSFGGDSGARERYHGAVFGRAGSRTFWRGVTGEEHGSF
ncbi:hypothetical protein GCWU000341_00275 [Oribacterium sp. oral taxon 078 str. F0262]|nr:hypothetical protein GCWU000341_00275 [Oribacterium sp. oral taxon 078 str. F0262]